MTKLMIKYKGDEEEIVKGDSTHWDKRDWDLK